MKHHQIRIYKMQPPEWPEYTSYPWRMECTCGEWQQSDRVTDLWKYFDSFRHNKMGWLDESRFYLRGWERHQTGDVVTLVTFHLLDEFTIHLIGKREVRLTGPNVDEEMSFYQAAKTVERYYTGG